MPTEADRYADRFAYGPAAPLSDADLNAALAGWLSKVQGPMPATPGQKLMGVLERTVLPRAEVAERFPEVNAERQRQIAAGADATLKALGPGDLTPEDRDALTNSPAAGPGTADLGLLGSLPHLLGTFAGKAAKTADHAAHALAEAMAKAGEPMEHIRRVTGWFKAPDGQWRFEIPDNNLQLTPDGKGWSHPELEAAYPDMADNVTVDRKRLPLPWLGYTDPETGQVVINKWWPKRTQRDTAAHELQHVVQQIEGHSPGTNPRSPHIRPVAEKILDRQKLESERIVTEYNAAFEQWRRDNPDAGTRWWERDPVEQFERQYRDLATANREAQTFLEEVNDPEMREWLIGDLGWSIYENSLGEIEARSVTDRLDWTSEQRRQTAPYGTQTVRPEDAYVLDQDFAPPPWAPTAPQQPAPQPAPEPVSGLPIWAAPPWAGR